MRVNSIFPGVYALLIGIGALFTSITLAKYPEIIYILPFKVGSLNFLKIGSGIVPYRYVWNSTEDLDIDIQLFGSMFEATRQFSKEALKFGVIEEIFYKKGVIYFSILEDFKLVLFLISNKKSEILKRNLQSFSEEISKVIDKNLFRPNSINLWDKKQIDRVVQKNFPYIPKGNVA